jgi:hypothetical protein
MVYLRIPASKNKSRARTVFGFVCGFRERECLTKIVVKIIIPMVKAHFVDIPGWYPFFKICSCFVIISNVKFVAVKANTPSIRRCKVTKNGFPAHFAITW